MIGLQIDWLKQLYKSFRKLLPAVAADVSRSHPFPRQLSCCGEQSSGSAFFLLVALTQQRRISKRTRIKAKIYQEKERAGTEGGGGDRVAKSGKGASSPLRVVKKVARVFSE